MDSPRAVGTVPVAPELLAGAPFLIDGMRFTLRGHHPQLGWLLDDDDLNTLGLSDAEIVGLRAASRLRLPEDGAGRFPPCPLRSRDLRIAMVAELPGWHLHGSDRDRIAPHGLLIRRDALGPAAGRGWLLTAADPISGAVVATKVEMDDELLGGNGR